jgi:DNA-binding transcriptional ArsR family regulator
VTRRADQSSGVLDELFGALADPTRRALMQRLLDEGPATATVLAADVPLTRQAVVKHLQALVDAGLATPERQGREVRYVATPEPLAVAVAWLLETSPQWDRRVERLRRLAQERVRTDLSMP